jgi:glycosyltransferase involved in cell wall biosynthesis
MNLLITAISSATSPLGICRHAHNLVRCAASRREVLLITLAIGKWQESYFRDLFHLEAEKLKIVPVDISNDAFARNLWYLQDLPKLADSVAADIVHLSFPAPVRRSALRCPVVVSLHDLRPYDERCSFGFPELFFNRVFLQRCLRDVDSVACVSEATLSKLKACFPRFTHRTALVIHNCVTIDSNTPAIPADAQHPFVLMVAQHKANKNILLAVKVFQELLRVGQMDKETILLLIGSCGSETTAITSLIKQRTLEKSVKLVEKVTDGELRWLYANCEFLMAPSSMEGFGFPIAEGLFCGSRVVCSDIPAFREIGGDTCRYFDLHAESDFSAMIEAISSALAEPARPAKRLERFSLEHVASKYVALYGQLRRNELEAVEGRGER